MVSTILSRDTGTRRTAAARPRAAASRIETIYLYSPIGETLFEAGDTAKSVVERLDAIHGVDEIHVRINSPGGDVFQGIGIYNALVRRDAATPVYVFIDGMAWSIASVIAMAGRRVAMASNAQFMIHNPAAVVFGEAAELRRVADLLDENKRVLIDAYQRHTNAGRDRIADWMDAETWFTASEAAQAGLVEVVEEALPIAASYPRTMRFRNMPGWVRCEQAARPQLTRARVLVAAARRRWMEQFQSSQQTERKGQ